MTVRYTVAQAQDLGLLPAPPVRHGRKTHTSDGHEIDPAFVGIRESGRTGFQAEVMKIARRCGWVCGQDDEADLPGLTYHALRGMGATERGWPDLVLLRRRDQRVLFRELKAENGECTPRQIAVLDLMRGCGLDAAVWRPSQLAEIAEVLR